MSWISHFTGRKPPESQILDWVTVSAADPLSKQHGFIRDLLLELIKLGSLPTTHYHIDLSKLESSKPFLTDDRELQAHCVHCLVIWLTAADRKANAFRSDATDPHNVHIEKGWEEIWNARRLLHAMLNKLLARKLPLSRETLHLMLDWCLEKIETYQISHWYPIPALLSALEEVAKTPDELGDLSEKIAKLGEQTSLYHQDNPTRKILGRIHSLIGRASEIPIAPGEAWADAALKDLATLDEPQRKAWAALLLHCTTASGGTPNAKWLKEAQTQLVAFDHKQISEFISHWFSLTDKKPKQSAVPMQEWIRRSAETKYSNRIYDLYQQLGQGRDSWRELEIIKKAMNASENPWEYLRNFANQPEARALFGNAAPSFDLPESPPVFAPIEDLMILPAHMDILVGLAWIGGLLTDHAVTRSLGLLAVSAYRKVPGIGPRAVRVGNASITALGMIGDTDALGQLALLKVKVKFGGAQIAINKAMTKLATKLDVSREDLEEMSVPAYGMTDVGRLTQALGDFTAELTVLSSRSTELTWIRADGKPQKSLPAAVKAEFAEDVKELMAAKKDIEKMLPAQAERLDGLYLQRKSWPLAVWRERYLDHPLIGALARRLLWNFTLDETTQTGVWLKDAIVDRSGNPLSLDEKTMVSLWHPLHQESIIVLGWRSFLEEWEIVQPFKQAHREIYLLTPAEEQTLVYSNRFAAHLLRQHQFNALCSARGWKNQLRLMVDAEYNPATRHLPQWDLRAEYWIEGAGDDTLESGAYRYLATDQIRFYQEGTPQLSAHAGGGGYGSRRNYHNPSEPIPLAQIDPMVFSEIMRDADLFVGVSSVGNDPNWLDGGRNETQQNYWGSYSFGDLNASAQTRKTILERLVPKLKIASACSFEDKFLIVQGKRHGYKIHLGSGNILIMPQDKYLCIVPAQAQLDKASDKIFLPFEGDRILSVILSKAFLLAADDKITDTTILRQLS